MNREKVMLTGSAYVDDVFCNYASITDELLVYHCTCWQENALFMLFLLDYMLPSEIELTPSMSSSRKSLLGTSSFIVPFFCRS